MHLLILVKACYCLEMYGQILSSWTRQICCVWWTDIKHLFSAQVDFLQRTDWKVETTSQIPFHLGSLMRIVFCQLNHQVVPSWISVGSPKFLSNESQSQTVECHEEESEYFSSLCASGYIFGSKLTFPQLLLQNGMSTVVPFSWIALDSDDVFSLFCLSLGKVIMLSCPLILRVGEGNHYSPLAPKNCLY